MVMVDSEHSLIQQLSKMKLTGFITEHNNIREAINLSELIDNSFQPNVNTDKIIKYLNNGVLLLAWMGYFFDEKSKRTIAPDSYFTDGIWVWPSYFSYYLEKYPSMKIDQEFLNYLEDRRFDFSTSEEFEIQKNELEQELSKKLK
jgi:hypothetical protein